MYANGRVACRQVMLFRLVVPLQIFRAQARMLGNLSQDNRPQFLSVVVGETILGPALTPQCPM